MGIIVNDTNGGTLKKLFKVLMTPFTTLNNTFFAYVNNVRQALQYTAQIIYLQRMLNDYFDSVTRGIYVANGNTVYLNYKYDVDEGFGDFIYDKSEGQGKYQLSVGETAGDYSFIIFVPNTISFDETYMRSLVNDYVFAGTEYNIVKF